MMEQLVSFRLTVAVLAIAALIYTNRCGGPTTAPGAGQPSEHVAHVVHPDSTVTDTYSVLVATQRAAIARLTDRASRLASDSAERRALAAELKAAKHVRAAAVVTTATPCGDTVRTAVVLREERAAGVLGFLKPRTPLLDVHQLTPGGRTLATQSFAAPVPAPRRFSLGLVAGYGVGATLVPAPFVGVGVCYTFIRF